MTRPDYWFTPTEFNARLAKTQAQLREQNLAALLAFQPETVTYLTGFFTRGYDSFQFAIIPVDDEPVIICRDMERYYLDLTAVYDNYFLWSDGDNKQAITAQAITEIVGKTGRVGIELDSWQLNAKRFLAMQADLPALTFIDCSDLVSHQRIIKSPAEIAYQRAAGKAAEAGMQAAIDTARPGSTEQTMAAAICAAMVLAGSDRPGPGVLSTGERAFHLHGGYNDRVIQPGDHVQVETTPNVRYYHARFMRPIKSGYASQADHDFVNQLITIQDQAIAAVGPGVPATIPDHIYRTGVLGAGLAERYTNKTFYSVGLILEPNSGEPLDATPQSTWAFAPGMTLHTYVLAGGFGISETIAITDTGIERLTNFPRQLFVAS